MTNEILERVQSGELCARCGGLGEIWPAGNGPDETDVCPACLGHGTERCPDCGGFWTEHKPNCPRLFLIECETCPACEGSGELDGMEALSVAVAELVEREEMESADDD